MPRRTSASSRPRAASGHSTMSGSAWLLVTPHLDWSFGANSGGLARFEARFPPEHAGDARAARATKATVERRARGFLRGMEPATLSHAAASARGRPGADFAGAGRRWVLAP